MDDEVPPVQLESSDNFEERINAIKWNNEIDAKYGYEVYTSPQERDAWMVNMAPAEMLEEQTKQIISAVDFYFLQENGSRFKITYPARPYLYVSVSDESELQAGSYLSKKYPFISVEYVDKEDLDLKNHLSGLKRKYIKLTSPSTVEQAKLKRDLMPLIRKNKARLLHDAEFTTLLSKQLGGLSDQAVADDVLSKFVDIREYDVAVETRVAIDEKLFVGKWYQVSGCGRHGSPSLQNHPRGVDDPLEPVVLAYDIECTKLPLKFPDSAIDQIMMISYMIDGHGFLIINRSIVSTDIDNFEYSPREDIKGFFTIFNEEDEIALIRRFFGHIQKVQPHVIVTYNGDFFDWPFVEARAAIRGLDMNKEIGFAKNSNDEYKNKNCIHMDAFKWVKRDSYLPVGSQNLKAVAKAKLRYDPMEVDPEEMCQMARDNPQALANYSVSDAVATYYLYMKYVQPFIFALCTIIPLPADDVLRKGSGTLCEALLMVEAFHGNIIFPNKFTGADEASWTKDGHKIESETYVGGHVEALEAGLFRADLPTRFRLVPAAIARLRDEAEETLEKELVREMGLDRSNVSNWEEAIAGVRSQLEDLLAHPARLEKPRIYHLDVGAMYPNIILTNRLQPSAIVNESTCMACSFNTAGATCKRKMTWEWRGELLPCSRSEFDRVMQQLEGENFGKPPRPFHTLKKEDQQKLEKKRIQDYCRKVYGKIHLTKNEMRESTVCQRENAFYVNTVLAFRDRRYEYKERLKKAKAAMDSLAADDAAELKSARGRVVLFESLQLAHKCILNSFYGYVMRKGSRWFSMEMAGIVCHTGANIITEARKLVEQIGRALELDTDGIWCLLPSSFPQNVTFDLQNCSKKRVTLSYPAAMLNAPVQGLFTNEQYHNLQPDGSYTVSKENSIYFEVDGPYQAIILPASKEEGKKLKKRYAVFNLDGSLAELKGFELKRRGELSIVKQFQSQVFKAFLRGKTLEEAYESVAREANYWLDLLFSRGTDLNDSELFELIGENRSMSRKLEDYGGQKSTSISTAKRLAEFLGDDVVKEAGLACNFVICSQPLDAPVTERALPIAIFHSEPAVTAHFIRKWTKMTSVNQDNIDIRDLLDWSYYIERLGNCIQKIVTIPAALQGIANPVPRIPNPDWLDNKLRNRVNAALQPKLTDHFNVMSKTEKRKMIEEEDGRAKRSRMAREQENDENAEIVEVEERSTQPRDGGGLRVANLEKEGVTAWIASLKAVWRKRRSERAQRKRDAARMPLQSSSSSSFLPSSRTLVGQSVFASAALNHWQIISVEEGSEKGVWWLWLTARGRLQRVSARARRTLLVNQKTPRVAAGDEALKQCVRRVLPRGRQAFYLYEYTVDESRLDSCIDRLRMEICTEGVEGVYESETPPLFRLLSTLGCAAQFKIIAGSADVEQASRLPVHNYLTDVKISSIFYYKYSQDTRQMIGVIDSAGGEGIFWTVGIQQQLPNLSTTYRTVFDQLDKEKYPPDLRPEIPIASRNFRRADEAEKELEKWLRRRVSDSTRIHFLSCICDKKSESSLRSLAILPVVPINVPEEPSGLLSNVDFGRSMAKRVVKHFFNSFIYLQDCMEWARYLHIPIGNIPTDPAAFGLDVFFARNLERAGHALWASASSRPDFGGKQVEDMRVSCEWSPLQKDASSLLCRPDLSMHYCVDVQVGALSVCALLQRAHLLEAEGADDALQLDGGRGCSVEPAVKILRSMLADLVRDIVSSNSKHADHLVLDLSRWLHCPSSLLFDPALVRYVDTLERKMCLLLSRECSRLGCSPLLASSSRFILSTQKTNRADADNLVALLTESLRSTPLFGACHFKPVTAWSTLLFKDSHNYTGIVDEEVESPITPSLEEDSERPIGEERRQRRRAECRWKAIDELKSLPHPLNEEFEEIVTGYLLLSEQRMTEPEERTEESLSAARGSIVRGEVLQRLLQIAEKGRRRGGADAESASLLIHAVCDALSSDSLVHDDISSAREQLYRLLSPPDTVTHKSIFIVSLLCSNCGEAEDVDISEDSAWSCPSCGSATSPNYVDKRVNDQLMESLSAFLVQDHQCTKCKQIKRENLAELCECSGTLANSQSREDLLVCVCSAKAVAEKRNLEHSFATADWLLQSFLTLS